MSTSTESRPQQKSPQELPNVTIRFCGDSGDGMQLTGTQFSNTAAAVGNDLCTFPDYPAEIRAPAGTTYGVSSYQLNFSSYDIHTPGDVVDTLVAMNPAALKTNLADLREGGILIVNEDAFNEQNLKLAGYASNPLDSESMKRYQLFKLPITRSTTEAVKDLGLAAKEASRCRNFYALGVILWLYTKPLEPTLEFIAAKFKKTPEIQKANELALRAGWNFGETTEIFASNFVVQKAKLPPGLYRKISGNEGIALGLIAASVRSKKRLFYGSYPITPASDILHELARHKNFEVLTFQAEDEIAAMASCIGCAFGGGLAVTGTSGPGLALKGEGIGLAVMTELPVVIVDVQRGGPSTGLPTKTEQADLNQAVFGRNSECPVPVIAAQSPGDCFYAAFEACKIALKHMTPVILLSDGYLANGAEPWMIPNVEELEEIVIKHPMTWEGKFTPYSRDENLVRPWVLPGTWGLQHRIGGLEKKNIDGTVNYDPENHEKMVKLRAAKVEKIADFIAPATPFGDASGGDLLIVGWGGTYGSITAAVQRLRARGQNVSSLHLRWINPLPKNLGEVLKRYKRVLVPELNSGQLLHILRATYLVDAKGLNKVKGRPFNISEIEAGAEQLLAEKA